jgi:peptide-methionine (R)-S-oxide reductase
MKDGTRRGFIFGAATVAATGLFLGTQHALILASDYAPVPDDDAVPVTIMRFADDGTMLGRVTVPKVWKSAREWKKQLTPIQFDVTRCASTEWAYSGALVNQHASGIYRCVDCDDALFDSETKFESGTGWPSFWAPIATENVRENKGMSGGIVRTEIKCSLCNAHLGHLFTDGPEPTGLRYCMNSAALRFLPRNKA